MVVTVWILHLVTTLSFIVWNYELDNDYDFKVSDWYIAICIKWFGICVETQKEGFAIYGILHRLGKHIEICL